MTVYIFDLGGVLINLDVKRCFLAFEKLMGEENMRVVLGMDSHGEGVKAVSVASKQLMADFERGLISSEDFVNEVLRYCHPDTTPQQVIDAWMAMLGDLPAERLLFVDSLRAKGHPVYLLSNGNDLHFDFINATYHLDAHFDGFFLSQKMHMSKPEPQIFEAVKKSIYASLLPSHKGRVRPLPQIIFIDDLPANRLAAEQTVQWRTFASIDELNGFLLNNR